MKFPLEDWSNWEASINRNGGSTTLVTKMADEWIGLHKAQFEGWVEAARSAK
jgi:glycine betaine/proline transport system substrate-binding protein